MANNAPVFGFNCTNPECGKLFKMKYPGKPGYFKVSCPHCKSKVIVNMPDLSQSEEGLQENQPGGNAPAINNPGQQSNNGPEQVNGNITPPQSTIRQEHTHQQQPPQPPHPQQQQQQQPQPQQPLDNSQKPAIAYADYPNGLKHFMVNDDIIITCPHCKARKMRYTAKKEGTFTFTCPGCSGKVNVVFVLPTQFISRENFNTKQWRLIQVKSFWRTIEYQLPLGEHTIGRFDMRKPSTIAIKGDSTMSRRSVSITAAVSQVDGFTYKLAVLSATNPVSLNGRQLATGEEVYLNLGDELTMGNTKFRFEEDPVAPTYDVLYG